MRQALVGAYQRDRPLVPVDSVVPTLEIPNTRDPVEGLAITRDIGRQPLQRARLVDLIGVDDEEVVGSYERRIAAMLASNPQRGGAGCREVHRPVACARFIGLVHDDEIDLAFGIAFAIEHGRDDPARRTFSPRPVSIMRRDDGDAGDRWIDGRQRHAKQRDLIEHDVDRVDPECGAHAHLRTRTFQAR